MLVLLEVAMLILYATVVDYAEEVGAQNDFDGGQLTIRYAFFQDVHVMIFIGFGFLMTFLKKYGFGALGFTFMIASFCIQWGMLVVGFWHRVHEDEWDHDLKLTLENLITGDFAAGAVLISFGAVIGKVNPFQLLTMAFIELFFYALNEMIGALELVAVDMGGSMYVHTFGAYFGLACSLALTRKSSSSPDSHANNGSTKTSDMFAMVGTIFLWMFWPSFNGALADGSRQHRVVINTVLALTGSCLSAFVASAWLREGKKFDMVDIQNATLAGGVAVGSASDLVIGPYGGMLTGIIGGLLSVVGYTYIQPFLSSKLGLHDTCGVHNLHGMPGIVGGLGGTISAATAGSKAYGASIALIFPKRAPSDATAAAALGVSPGTDRTAGEQATYQFFTLLITLGIALVSGYATGMVIRQPFFEPPAPQQWFDDAEYWEVPVQEKDIETEPQPRLVIAEDAPSQGL